MANVLDLMFARRAKLARASRVSRFWSVVVRHLPGSRLPLEYPEPAKPTAATPAATKLAAAEPPAPD